MLWVFVDVQEAFPLVFQQDSYNPASLISTAVGLMSVDSSAQVSTLHHMHNQVMVN